MSETEPEEPERPPQHRLDPDRAAAAAAATRRAPARAPAVDTRRYRLMIGLLALALFIAFSVHQLTTKSHGTAGVPAGQRLHFFAAPLAASTLVGDPNLTPPCTLADHDRRALNVCILARRGPLVLGFFATGSHDCERQVDALQAVSRRYSPRQVQFAAVAVAAGQSATRALVRSHGWTIPVAYDRDGSVGALYGVAVCPMLELARRGGVVAARLIGNHWLSVSALDAQVRRLVAR